MKAKLNAVIGLIFAMSVAFVSAQVPTVSPYPSGGGGGNATIITALPMIRSQDALRNYALSIAHFGNRNVQAPSMDWSWPGMITGTEVSGAFGEEILARLFETEFAYKLTNPDDNITGFVYLYDVPFDSEVPVNMLFHGSANYSATDLLTGKPQYNIWMLDIPLPLSNVSSAEVLVLDSDGITARRIPIVVKNGQLMFQPWLAGSPNGILVSRDENGRTTTYDLSNPVGKVPTSLIERPDYKVDGHYIYETGEKPITVKIIETYNRPSVFIRVLGGAVVTIDVMGLVQEDGKTYFERPGSMEVIPNGKDGGWTVPLNSDKPTELKWSIGEFRVRFNWINFGKPNMIYTGPMDGGKG